VTKFAPSEWDRPRIAATVERVREARATRDRWAG
jgi:hypothetical protein